MQGQLCELAVGIRAQRNIAPGAVNACNGHGRERGLIHATRLPLNFDWSTSCQCIGMFVQKTCTPRW